MEEKDTSRYIQTAYLVIVVYLLLIEIQTYHSLFCTIIIIHVKGKKQKWQQN